MDRRTIPAASRERNSATAIFSLSGSRLRALAKSGRPEVSTKCRTPWRGLGISFPSPTMLGNAARSVRTAGTRCEIWTRQTWMGRRRQCNRRPPSRNRRTEWLGQKDPPAGNERTKKSIPRMGLETAARTNETTKVWRPKLSFLVTFPQAESGLPSAPDNIGPEEAAADL